MVRDDENPEFPDDATITIERMDHGPTLVIEEAERLAFEFFTKDASSIGPKAYDAQVARGDPDRITVPDIVAINTTMRARSPHTAWEALTVQTEPQPWLQAIPRKMGLFRIEDAGWAALRPAVATALEQTVGPYRNLSVATKVLHLKRQYLFPVLDSLVIQQVGGVGRPAMDVLDHLREQGRNNRMILGLIAATLEKFHIHRTEVRILDALLWSSHPAAGLAPKLDRWEHVVRLRR